MLPNLQILPCYQPGNLETYEPTTMETWRSGYLRTYKLGNDLSQPGGPQGAGGYSPVITDEYYGRQHGTQK